VQAVKKLLVMMWRASSVWPIASRASSEPELLAARSLAGDAA